MRDIGDARASSPRRITDTTDKGMERRLGRIHSRCVDLLLFCQLRPPISCRRHPTISIYITTTMTPAPTGSRLDTVPENVLARICEATLRPSVNFVCLGDLSLSENEPEYMFRPSRDNWHAKRSAYHYRSSVANADGRLEAAMRSLTAARRDFLGDGLGGWVESVTNVPLASTADLYCVRADLSLSRPTPLQRAAANNSWYLRNVLYAGIEYSREPQQLPGAALGVFPRQGQDPVRARQEAAEVMFWMLRKIPARVLYIIVPPEVWDDGLCDAAAVQQTVKGRPKWRRAPGPDRIADSSRRIAEALRRPLLRLLRRQPQHIEVRPGERSPRHYRKASAPVCARSCLPSLEGRHPDRRPLLNSAKSTQRLGVKPARVSHLWDGGKGHNVPSTGPK